MWTLYAVSMFHTTIVVSSANLAAGSIPSPCPDFCGQKETLLGSQQTKIKLTINLLLVKHCVKKLLAKTSLLIYKPLN